MQLLNAFSLQMLDLQDSTNVSFSPADVWVDGFTGLYVYKDQNTQRVSPLSTLESYLGHQDIANILGCKMNRGSCHLKRGETALIAQVTGGRLPEGTTTIPEGMSIKFYWVHIQ